MNAPEQIKLALPADEKYREMFGVSVEYPWALRTPDGFYKVDNIPFYSSSVCVDDVVQASPHSDDSIRQDVNGVPVWTIDRMVRPSRHATLHVIGTKPRNHDVQLENDQCFEPFKDVLEFIKTTDCTFEGNDTGSLYLVAIDIPPQADRTNLRILLKQGYERDHWAFAFSDDK
jgi:uncharacterized protein DUF4265